MKLTKDRLIQIIKEEMDSMPPKRGVYATERSFTNAPMAKNIPTQNLDRMTSDVIKMMRNGEGFGRSIQLAVYNNTKKEDQPTEIAVANHIADKYGSIMNFFDAMGLN